MKTSGFIWEGGKEVLLAVLTLGLVLSGLYFLFSGERFVTISVSDYSLTDVEFSPDGRLIAVAGGATMWKGRWISSGDLRVRLYDPVDGRLVHELDGHTRFVRGCTFSPSGDRLLTISRELLLWNPETGELALRIDPGERTILRGAFLPGGDRLVTGARTGTVQIWDTETGELLQEFQAHQRAVTSLATAREANFFVTSTVGQVIAWDSDSLEQIAEFPVEFVPISIRVTDQDRLLLVPNGPTIVSCDLESGEAEVLLESEQKWVGNIAVSPDGVYLANSSKDGELLIWSFGDMKRRARLLPNGSDCFGLSFSPDGTRLAAVGRGGELRLWDWNS